MNLCYCSYRRVSLCPALGSSFVCARRNSHTVILDVRCSDKQLTCTLLHLDLLPYRAHQSTLLSTLCWRPSVVSPTSLSHGCFISATHLETSSKISFPVVVPCINYNPKSSSVTHKFESIPRVKSDSRAVSDASQISSTARENAKKSFPLSSSWSYRLVTGEISFCVSTQAHICKYLLLLWANKIANFHHALFHELSLIEAPC